MPVIFQCFENYPDNKQFSIDLEKIYGETLNNKIVDFCQSPDTRLYCGQFNGRWITAALISETNTDAGKCIVISHIYVREATRRRGVGSQLMENIINTEYTNKVDDKNGNVKLLTRVSGEKFLKYEDAKVFLQALRFKPENSLSSEFKIFIYQP